MIDWARRAEDLGFSTVATIDRVAYPSYESLTALAGVAGATERVALLTNILLAPTRNPVLLAKQAASVDQLSGGRLTLGLGVGARDDDFAASGTSFSDRGRRFDRMLDVMHRAWKGEPVEGARKPVSPPPVRDDRVPILMGGTSDAAIRRTVTWAAGWTAGGAPAEVVFPFLERIRAAWKDAGRKGEPRVVTLTYYSIGEEDASTSYLTDYYGTADWVMEMARNRCPRTPDALRRQLEKFRNVGVDELIFVPTVAGPGQVEGLAEAVL